MLISLCEQNIYCSVAETATQCQVIVKSMMDPWQHSLAAEQQSKVTEQDR